AAGAMTGITSGVNPAGAAAGCFLTDWAFIPSAGLWVTQLSAVALNLVAAIGALRLAAPTSTESGSAAAHVRAAITAADTMDVGAVKVTVWLTAVVDLVSRGS